MFFNLKYHIASLVAVFLAIGLGMLIGSAMQGGDVLDGRQQQLATSLERQLEHLRQRNRFLQDRVSTLEMDNSIQRQFESQVLPLLVAGKLQGRSVAVIVTAGRPRPDNLLGVLETAGAGIQSVTVLNGLEVENRDELIKKLGWPEMDEKEFTSRAAVEIAGSLLTGKTAVVETLSAGRVISMDGGWGGPPDAVILTGGSQDKGMIKIDTLDYPVIDLFRSRGVSVYGVEDSCAAYSYMKEYQKKGITTVDNIDTVPGQVSLVYAMAGSHGQYGVKSSARMLLPAMEYGVPANAR